MVTVKLRQLLGLRRSSFDFNTGSINQYDIDDENDNDIQEAHNDLAASIANRELLLTAAAIKHTNNNNNNNNDIHLLRDEIKLLRDEMRERFDVLEKKFMVDCDTSFNSVDVSMDSKSVYKVKDKKALSSQSLEKDAVKLVSPVSKPKDDIGRTEVVRSHQNKDKVVGAMSGKDDLKRVKRNKPKKQQAKGKRRQKKRNKIESPPSSPTSIIPTGYHGIVTILVTLINAIATLLLMRGGKRLYMLLAFITASYLFKGEMNTFSSVSDGISTSIGGWFSIGSSFIQGVRALEDCPEQYIATDIDIYDVGSKVTIEEKVYECTESPCGWKIIGTCVGYMFLSSSASAQPTIQTLGSPVHFPSMMPPALDTDGDESNPFGSESVPVESSLGRVRIHSTDKTRQGLFGDDDEKNTQTLYYPDYVLAKCVTESSTIFDSNQSSATIEECCDQWLFYVNRDDCITKSSPLTTPSPSAPPTQSGVDTVISPTSSMPSSVSDTASPIVTSPLNEKDDTEWPTMSPTKDTTSSTEPSLMSITASPMMSSSNEDDAANYPTLPPTSGWPTFPEWTWTYSPTMSPIICVGKNTEVCGCASVNQADYRGTISTTESGKECKVWDEVVVQTFPDSGLEDNNYCRNPNGAYNRAGCYTGEYEWEDCNVPICEESLPSAYPSSSLHPTISPKPTASLFPTQGPQCEGSNPEVCGCVSVGQADYRGTIGTTASGKECISWGEVVVQTFPDSGLEDNNYCRNPNPDYDERAWCNTEDGFEDCDVPICEDSLPSAYPSSSLHPTISPMPTTSSPTPEPKCVGSNPEVCGCVSVKQNDYRGTINVTASGKECMRWDEDSFYNSEYFPDAGLEDNNYCRNLPLTEWNERAWCNTADSLQEYCDVPICENILPSAYPSSSLHPTGSPKPTISFSPTQEPKCEGSNPEVCGCASVMQADYRGRLNVAGNGKECISWDETAYPDFPSDALKGNNYCRQPHKQEGEYGGAWCYTAIDNDETQPTRCDVPYCFPPASSCPSSLDENANVSLSEELQAACPYHQCLADSWKYEYQLDDYQTLSRSEVKPDCLCPFEVWDCEFGRKGCIRNTVRQNANECCISKSNNSNWTAAAASCECSIKPDCEAGDPAKCKDFAEYCCDENDQQCKCDYQTKACRIALESDLGESTNREYCGYGQGGGGDGAAYACCGYSGEYSGNQNIGLCSCDFWMPLCADFPNIALEADNLGGFTCDAASTSCCGEVFFSIGEDNKHCNCDFLTYAVESLGYDDGGKESTCAEASNIAPDNEIELQALQSIYNETSGDYWLNNTGWTTEQDQCSWFGIICDEQGFVIEINLPNNNMTGEFPSISLSSFYILQRL